MFIFLCFFVFESIRNSFLGERFPYHSPTCLRMYFSRCDFPFCPLPTLFALPLPIPILCKTLDQFFPVFLER